MSLLWLLMGANFSVDEPIHEIFLSGNISHIFYFVKEISKDFPINSELLSFTLQAYGDE